MASGQPEKFNNPNGTSLMIFCDGDPRPGVLTLLMLRGEFAQNPSRAAPDVTGLLSTRTMPSVAGMGLEFSCGEDPRLIPAVASSAGAGGASPPAFVRQMESALEGALSPSRTRERPPHVAAGIPAPRASARSPSRFATPPPPSPRSTPRLGRARPSRPRGRRRFPNWETTTTTRRRRESRRIDASRSTSRTSIARPTLTPTPTLPRFHPPLSSQSPTPRTRVRA